jgi:hypothetical protein
MKKENYKITVKDTEGNVYEDESTGLIYDANISACKIHETFENQYLNKGYIIKSELVK